MACPAAILGGEPPGQGARGCSQQSETPDFRPLMSPSRSDRRRLLALRTRLRRGPGFELTSFASMLSPRWDGRFRGRVATACSSRTHCCSCRGRPGCTPQRVLYGCWSPASASRDRPETPPAAGRSPRSSGSFRATCSPPEGVSPTTPPGAGHRLHFGHDRGAFHPRRLPLRAAGLSALGAVCVNEMERFRRS